MDIFTEHFKRNWRTDINNLNVKLLQLDKICRICFTTVDISPIQDMNYQDITMANIMETCLPLELDSIDMPPNHLCSGCTNQLLHFYSFRENCKISEQALLLSKDNDSEVFDDINNEDLQAIEVVKCSYNDDVADSSIKKASRKRKLTQQSKKRIKTESSKVRRKLKKRSDSVILRKILETNDSESNEDTIDEKPDKIQLKKVHKFVCTECQMEFKTRGLLREHCKEKGHAIKKSRRQCNICGKLVNTSQMKQHMCTHSAERPYMCDKCPAKFTIRSNLHRHTLTHTGEKPHVCTYCGNAYKQKTTLNIHIKTRHDGTNSDATPLRRKRSTNRPEKRYNCDYCDRIYMRLSNLHAHMQKHKELRTKYAINNDTTGNNESNNLNSSDSFNKQKDDLPITGDNPTSSGPDLSVDGDTTKSDSPKAAFTCPVCSRTYKTNNQLKQHVTITHGEKKYLCTECGRGFATNTLLKSHSKVHTREKPYKCTECGKQYAHSGSLDAHMNKHSGSKPHRCDICGKCFTQFAHLSSHMVLHTGEKSHVCTHCGRAFSQKCNLTVHMRTHTGEKPYVCDICGQGFYDSSSRKRHRKGHGEDEIRRADEALIADKNNGGEKTDGGASIGNGGMTVFFMRDDI